MLKHQLARIHQLKLAGVIGQFEVDKVEADYASIQAQIAGMKNAIAATKARIASSRHIVKDSTDDQMSPIIQNLEFLKNENIRLQQKIEEGKITSPVSGIVSQITHFAGERIINDPIFNIVEKGTVKLVLYYSADKTIPREGDEVDLWVPSLGSYVKTRVTGHSKDTVNPPSQIKRNYHEDEKLVRVFLSPINKKGEDFVVGGVIKNPTNLGRFTNWVVGTAYANDR